MSLREDALAEEGGTLCLCDLEPRHATCVGTRPHTAATNAGTAYDTLLVLARQAR